jgi:uncharacterized protein (DUF934 family)
MSKIVTDSGFHDDDWGFGFHPSQEAAALIETGKTALALDVDPAFDVAGLSPWLDRIDLIRIRFAAFSDGRGFSQARQLRMLGFAGRLRAVGPIVVDQYSMARRAGFDEVEIDDALALRQPEHQWLAQSDWQAPSYQQRLRQFD